MDEASVASIYANIAAPRLPFAAIFIALFVSLPLAALAGYLLGRRRWNGASAEQREMLGKAGETTLGGILAIFGLLVAFSFGNSLGWASDRQDAILDEANALGTAFLRADYLAEPHRTELREALHAYARTRIFDRASVVEAGGILPWLDRTLEAQARLWPLTVAGAAPPAEPAVQTFVAGAVNDVIDAHATRFATTFRPAVETTGLLVFAAALTSLFLIGNRSALQGRPLTWRTFVLAAFLIVVLATIADIQRGADGGIRVDFDVLRATIRDMETSLAAEGTAQG
jgi:hypothetical protein